ncbi:MAG: PfaD family polyunsaturated fatty acid/polyketide biosynthesis protein [Elusimicrobiota bacterium]
MGTWRSGADEPAADAEGLRAALIKLNEPFYVLDTDHGPAAAAGGAAVFGPGGEGLPVLAHAPAGLPAALGDPAFLRDHGLRFAYVSGAMANGIGSAEICEALAREGMLGFFGAAGLTPAVVEQAIDRLQSSLDGLPYGCNLIHSPNEPDLEDAITELYIRKGVRRVEASAFMGLTPAIVRYRAQGLRRADDGSITAPNRVVAKVSRVEVAEKFFSPAPAGMLRELAAAGRITAQEVELAAHIPVAQDLTVEADSGGHTDGRPLVTLLPTMISLRDRLQERFGYADALRVGAAGGISTPLAAASAFAMGAAYVLLGSAHQACVESGSCDAVRRMLAECGQADTATAPAADMFELGAKVQVLKRGTMFAMRAAKLYELYHACAGLDAIPAAERSLLERQVFLAPLEDIWTQTRAFFAVRDPAQIVRAEADPKHRMALVFRWYLGQASRWANAGEPSRRIDYQIWCGPAMGAFNEWAKGTFLERPENRRIVDVAKNILFGAALQSRLNILRSQGVVFPRAAATIRPVASSVLEEYFR